MFGVWEVGIPSSDQGLLLALCSRGNASFDLGIQLWLTHCVVSLLTPSTTSSVPRLSFLITYASFLITYHLFLTFFSLPFQQLSPV